MTHEHLLRIHPAPLVLIPHSSPRGAWVGKDLQLYLERLSNLPKVTWLVTEGPDLNIDKGQALGFYIAS